MKKYTRVFFLLFIVVLVSMPSLFAQSGYGTEIIELDLSTMFLTFSSFIAAVTVLTGWVKKLGNHTKATPNKAVQYVSWVVGFILAIIGWYLKLGFFQDLNFMLATIYGFSASLTANGLYDSKIVEKIISIFVLLFKKNN